MFKAFVSDLDDTLLTRDHRLGEKTLRVLSGLMERGVRVILASGRAAASIRIYSAQIGTTDPIIAFNGAQVIDQRDGSKLYAREIPRDTALEMLAWLKKNGLGYAQVYQGDDWFYEKRCADSEYYERSSGVRGTQVASLADAVGTSVPKILAVADPKIIAEIRPQAQEAFRGVLNATTSCANYLEITAPGADKGSAMEALAQALSLTPDDTICAGDSLNDLPMLRWTHHALTVSNAREEVRREARYLAGSAYEDGVAEYLEKLIP